MLTTPVRHQWSILLSRQEGTRWLQCCSPTKSANSLILHLGLCTFRFFWFALRPWANDHFPNSPSSAILPFSSCVSPSYRLARSPSSPLSSFLSSLSQGSACTSPIAELSRGPCGTSFWLGRLWQKKGFEGWQKLRPVFTLFPSPLQDSALYNYFLPSWFPIQLISFVPLFHQSPCSQTALLTSRLESFATSVHYFGHTPSIAFQTGTNWGKWRNENAICLHREENHDWIHEGNGKRGWARMKVNQSSIETFIRPTSYTAPSKKVE